MQAQSSSLICSTLNVYPHKQLTEEVVPKLYQNSSNLTKSDNSAQRQEKLEEEDQNNEDEFTFDCQGTNPSISADDIFHNGEFRSTVQIPRQDYLSSAHQQFLNLGHEYLPVKKVFFERSNLSPSSHVDGVAEGPYGSWLKNEVATDSKERCRKSNSTGFSKLWRFRDLLSRSNSDGKDTFLFLNENGKGNKKEENNETTASSSASEKKNSPGEKKGSANEKTSSGGGGRGRGRGRGRGSSGEGKAKVKGVTNETASVPGTSSYARLYGRHNNRGKEGERRKSYLPYKQDLVGFFTNASSMSRNVHPY